MKRLKAILPSLWRHKKRTVVILIVLLAVGYFFFPKQNQQFEVEKVKKDTILKSITASGSVASETTVTLNFLAGGKLVYVGAKKGDSVTSGQTIATLDQNTFRKNLEIALIDYAKQQETYQSTVRKYEAGVLEGQQRVSLDSSSKQAYSTVPQATLIHELVQGILVNNHNDVQRALSSVDLQRAALDQSILVSPINGILIRADATTPGVNIGATTTYTIADPDNLVFKIDVDEADIGQVTLGQLVNVTLDAFPDRTIPLAVTHIDFASHTTETGGNVYTVEVKLPPNLDYKYRIGMSGDAEIVMAQKKNVITVPMGSVTDDMHVYVKTDNRYEKRKISTGLQSDIAIEVLQGLKEGDEIALQPEEVEKTRNK